MFHFKLNTLKNSGERAPDSYSGAPALGGGMLGDRDTLTPTHEHPCIDLAYNGYTLLLECYF